MRPLDKFPDTLRSDWRMMDNESWVHMDAKINDCILNKCMIRSGNIARSDIREGSIISGSEIYGSTIVESEIRDSVITAAAISSNSYVFESKVTDSSLKDAYLNNVEANIRSAYQCMLHYSRVVGSICMNETSLKDCYITGNGYLNHEDLEYLSFDLSNFLTFNNLGKVQRTLMIVKDNDQKVHVRTGCFQGNPETFTEQVKKVHQGSEHERRYLLALKYALEVFNVESGRREEDSV